MAVAEHPHALPFSGRYVVVYYDAPVRHRDAEKFRGRSIYHDGEVVIGRIVFVGHRDLQFIRHYVGNVVDPSACADRAFGKASVEPVGGADGVRVGVAVHQYCFLPVPHGLRELFVSSHGPCTQSAFLYFAKILPSLVCPNPTSSMSEL